MRGRGGEREGRRGEGREERGEEGGDRGWWEGGDVSGIYIGEGVVCDAVCVRMLCMCICHLYANPHPLCACVSLCTDTVFPFFPPLPHPLPHPRCTAAGTCTESCRETKCG